MPYKNYEDTLKQSRKYTEEHREEINRKAREKYKRLHPTKLRKKLGINYPKCIYCKKSCNSYSRKFCSHDCQWKYEYDNYIIRWLNGEETGNRKNSTISRNVRKYMFKLHDSKCELCGWNIINKYTNRIPLNVHHIDGNPLNSIPENLQLLCPNCHSLTSNYGRRGKLV